MAHIQNFQAQPGSTFNDNSGSVVTISPQGTTINQTKVSPEEAKPNIEVQDSPLYFDESSVDKVDLIRILYAMWKLHFFKLNNGKDAPEKVVFETFSKVLHTEMKRPSNNLGATRSNKGETTDNFKIFKDLQKEIEKFESGEK
jgi:hypothetical protein